MLDVRNAIANILDIYTLSQVTEAFLKKLRQDRILPSRLDSGGSRSL